jgi:hypothetical protein
MVLRLLDDGWRLGGEPDLWELHDATLGVDDQPAAVASTRPLDDGHRVQLVGLAVAVADGVHTIAQRMVEELVQALRARGASALVAAVPGDAPDAMDVLEGAGLRRVDGTRPALDGDDPDLVWFHVLL